MSRFRDKRKLPPLLQIMRIATFAFPLGALVVFAGAAASLLLPSFYWPVDASRVLPITANVIFLSTACDLLVDAYSLRFRQPGRQTYPLDSPQSQAWWLLLLTALPLCGLVLGILLPLTDVLVVFVLGPVMLLGAVILIAAVVYAKRRWQGLI